MDDVTDGLRQVRGRMLLWKEHDVGVDRVQFWDLWDLGKVATSPLWPPHPPNCNGDDDNSSGCSVSIKIGKKYPAQALPKWQTLLGHIFGVISLVCHPPWLHVYEVWHFSGKIHPRRHKGRSAHQPWHYKNIPCFPITHPKAIAGCR